MSEEDRRCADCVFFHRLDRQPIEGLCNFWPPQFVGPPVQDKRELTQAHFEFSLPDAMASCGQWRRRPKPKPKHFRGGK